MGFTAIMADLRDCYTERKEPFWTKGGSACQLEWDSVIEIRVPVNRLEETLEQHANKKGRRAIVISCNENEMTEATEIIQMHNEKEGGFTEVEIAWATKDDVYAQS